MIYRFDLLTAVAVHRLMFTSQNALVMAEIPGLISWIRIVRIGYCVMAAVIPPCTAAQVHPQASSIATHEATDDSFLDFVRLCYVGPCRALSDFV